MEQQLTKQDEFLTTAKLKEIGRVIDVDVKTSYTYTSTNRKGQRNMKIKTDITQRCVKVYSKDRYSI